MMDNCRWHICDLSTIFLCLKKTIYKLSRNMASGELVYCLFQAKKNGAKIAYVPTAIVHHQMAPRSRSWMIQRAYWQGITDGLFDFLLYKRKCWDSLLRTYFDVAAMIVLFGYAAFFMILFV